MLKASLTVASCPTRSVSSRLCRVAAGFGAQERDGGVGGPFPLGVELLGAGVEEAESGEVRRTARAVEDLRVEGAGWSINADQVEAFVVDERRSSWGRA